MDFDQEVNTLEWENADENGILKELQGFSERCNAATKQLKAMFANNECKKTEDILESLAYGDLGSEGWIAQFHTTNMDSFSKYLNGGKPSWYSDLTTDRQKKYDMVMDYYRDTAYLKSSCSDLSKILLDLVDRQILRDGFRVGYMIFNFEDAGINEKTFKTLETDVLMVSKRINQNWGNAERMAETAKRYLEDNRDRMEFSALKTGYRNARLKDYISDFQSTSLSTSFGVLSDGSFYVKADILSKMRVIDRYTNRLAQSDYLEDVMKKLIEDLKNILNKQLMPFEKDAKTEWCGNASFCLRRLINALIEYAQTVLDVLKQYQDADPNKSPFCFMGIPGVYSSVQSKYGLNPNRDDPWDKGSRFTDLYVMEAVALTEHCEEFVRKQGNVNYRD